MPAITEDTKKIREWLEANVDKYQSKKVCFNEGAVIFKTTWKALQNIWYGRTKMQRLRGTAPGKISSGGLTEDQLRSKHDLYYIVKKAAVKLTSGKYLPESEFVQAANIKGPGYRQALDHPDFNDYHGKAGGITYWGNPANIKRMKDEHVLF